jgi:hypothetical protein
MNKSQQIKFQSLYRKHVSALKRHGKAESTIDVYARAVRRVATFWDCCPDRLTQEQLEAHFDALVASHSWSTVQALQYLSRYLYRGVISNRNIIHDDGERITFRYQDGRTKRWETRTLPGEDFMALLLQHVLPQGLRRARDYGFLHGNSKRLLKLVQWVLRVHLPAMLAPKKAQFRCPHCHGSMHVIRMTPARPQLESG